MSAVKHRIALGVRYNGARYHGWQSQSGLITVQAAVEAALSAVADADVHIYCAGRTDAGVHATAQVVHFDTMATRSDHAWVFGANSNLPPDIAALWAKPVTDAFHARYSARARRYRFLIYNHTVRPALMQDQVTWCYKPLDEKKMLKAAQCLLGEHDFTSFQGRDCQAKHATRTLHHLSIQRRGRMILVEVAANAFLKHMVRNIVGTLVAVGEGDQPVEWVEQVLAAKDRTQAGVTLRPNGLYLVEVSYPPEFHLPVEPMGPYFWS